MSDLLQKLSRELGRDAVDEANSRHPELRSATDGQVARLIDAVEYVLQSHQWPRTSEFAERAYKALEADGILAEILPPAAPSAPRTFQSSADEEEFLRRAPLEEVRDYLQAKYAKG